MNRPGQRTLSLSEMQLMGQNAAQKAAGRAQVLEQTMGELQRQQRKTDANLLQIIDALKQQQDALDAVIERVEALTEKVLEVDARTTTPKRKPGRPRGSKNKPKATPAAEAVPQETEAAPGEAAE